MSAIGWSVVVDNRAAISGVNKTLYGNMHVDVELLMTLILSLTSQIGPRHTLYIIG
jgi:hypothetical protein